MRLITVTKETNLKQIFSIPHIGHTKIKWETYVNKKGVAQCHRCQNFGHGTKNCNLNPRCVKCGQDHLTKDCTKTKDTPAVCANCNEQHPANYSKCTSVIDYVNKIQNSKVKRTLKTTRQTSTFNPQDFPLLQKSRMHTPPRTTPWPSYTPASENDSIEKIQKLFEEAEKLKSLCNIDSLLKKLQTLNETMSRCTTDGERLMALIHATK